MYVVYDRVNCQCIYMYHKIFVDIFVFIVIILKLIPHHIYNSYHLFKKKVLIIYTFNRIKPQKN